MIIFSVNAYSTHATSTLFTNTTAPVGTKYNVNADVQVHFENVTSGEILVDQRYQVNINFTIVSKRLDFNYVGWGFVIELPPDTGLNFNGENLTDISIPPIIAVKEGTRQIYLPQMIFDLIQNQSDLQNLNIQSILRELFLLKLNKDFYILNPMYVNPNLDVGDTVDYGFAQISTNKQFIVKGTALEKTSVTSYGTTYETIKVGLEFNKFSTMGEILGDILGLNLENDMSPEIKNLLDNITLSSDLYYDTAIGWLVKADVSVDLDPSALPENVTGYANGNLYVSLIDPGNLNIGGKSFLARLIGIPIEGLVGADLVIILIIFYIVLRRRRA